MQDLFYKNYTPPAPSQFMVSVLAVPPKAEDEILPEHMIREVKGKRKMLQTYLTAVRKKEGNKKLLGKNAAGIKEINIFNAAAELDTFTQIAEEILAEPPAVVFSKVNPAMGNLPNLEMSGAFIEVPLRAKYKCFQVNKEGKIIDMPGTRNFNVNGKVVNKPSCPEREYEVIFLTEYELGQPGGGIVPLMKKISAVEARIGEYGRWISADNKQTGGTSAIIPETKGEGEDPDPDEGEDVVK